MNDSSSSSVCLPKSLCQSHFTDPFSVDVIYYIFSNALQALSFPPSHTHTHTDSVRTADRAQLWFVNGILHEDDVAATLTLIGDDHLSLHPQTVLIFLILDNLPISSSYHFTFCLTSFKAICGTCSPF